jgi:uronate dehydrogenase
VVGDLNNADLVDGAAAEMDTIIHLAAVPDDDDFLTQLLPSNIVGVYHVLEAARRHAVKRLILASSVQVVWDPRKIPEWPVSAHAPGRPLNWYAVTKVFAEAAGYMYANRFGIDVLAIRVGACPRDEENAAAVAASEIKRDAYFSPGDVAQFFIRCVETTGRIGFQILNATSKPTESLRFDLEPARQLLGYEPQDQWPTDLEKFF